jgi:16S rRNA (cytosine967-C5)-methyltransferase
VNAVGRRLAADGQIVAQTQDAARLNTPDWLWRKLSADWGTEHAPALAAAHLVPAPHDLTVRTPADTEALRTEVGGTLLPTRTLRLADRPQLSTLAGFAAGAWWAQDAASALPVRLFGPVEGLRVLDLCAAPGGKTLQLAAAGAHVTAVDLSERRMARVVENLARTGLAAETVVADVLKWKAEAPFDAVLLDAPCSATGTIRRHPDLPYRTDPKALERLTALQAKLMDRAWGWVAPGGAMVYATCSLLRAEGEEQSTAFAARHPEARLRRPSDPALGPFLNKAGALRTRPDQWSDLGGLDGFFAVCFQRS